MERWLNISNCQTFGLSNSFMLLNPGFSVESVDIWTYRANADHYNSTLGDYFRVLIHPEILHLPEHDLSKAQHVSQIPSAVFSSYHPDLCFVLEDNKALSGPMGEYQSIIALAAFQLGLSLSDTRQLYCGQTYQIAGYMDGWEEDRDNLIAHFRHYGIDISADFARWSRGGAFMYSINHPTIEVIYDVARSFMRSCGVAILETPLRPVDNLISGPCFPVYPEIADHLSISGSYLFKRNGAYVYDSLDQFLQNSFRIFSEAAGPLRVDPSAQGRYDRIQALLKGEA